MVRRSKKYKWADRAGHFVYLAEQRDEQKRRERMRRAWNAKLLRESLTESIFENMNKSVICVGGCVEASPGANVL